MGEIMIDPAERDIASWAAIGESVSTFLTFTKREIINTNFIKQISVGTFSER